MKTERIENMCGGEGHVIIRHILGERRFTRFPGEPLFSMNVF